MQQLLGHVQVAPGINDVRLDPYEHLDPGQVTQSVLSVKILEVVQPGPVQARRSMVRDGKILELSLIHISEPTRLGMISYAVFCLKKKKKNQKKNKTRQKYQKKKHKTQKKMKK